MFADALNFTHNGTGGSGTITLAARTGYPQATDAFGTSGTRIVYYEIAEYTDSTFATLSKYERGMGSLVLSTNVLTRTLPQVTWTSGGSYNSITASALTFGNTAANFIITLTASAFTQLGALPIVQNSSGSGFSGQSIGYQSFNTRVQYNSGTSVQTLVNGSRFWVPLEFRGGLINNVALDCQVLHASAAARMGLYDWDIDGLPGNLISEFTSSTQIDLTATGIRHVAVASKISPAPGWYWGCVQSNDSTAQLATVQLMGASGMGISGSAGREIQYYDKGATYGALPATGDKTASSLHNTSSGGQLWMGFN